MQDNARPAGSAEAEECSPDSNVGKWDAWYRDLVPEKIGAFRYGDTVTYRMASAFMADVGEVEDWGCGAGGFKRFYHGKYIGVDGSKTPFADRIVDLCNYTSPVEGIVMRHVLEHNYRWQEILDGAVRSFTRKFCLILFTPFSESTREIAHNRAHGVDVPDLSFSRADIEARLAGLRWELFDDIPTDSGYKVEHVYLVWRGDEPKPQGRDAVLRRLLGEWLGEATTAVALGLERAGRHDLMRTLLPRSGATARRSAPSTRPSSASTIA